jgi:hypothetical protein
MEEFIFFSRNRDISVGVAKGSPPLKSSGQNFCYRSRGPGSIPGAARFSEK